MRKAKPKKRQILPDPVFGDVKVTRFVNHLMYDGKKNTAFEIFYSALETVKAKMPNEEKSALEIWKAARLASLHTAVCLINNEIQTVSFFSCRIFNGLPNCHVDACT